MTIDVSSCKDDHRMGEYVTQAYSMLYETPAPPQARSTAVSRLSRNRLPTARRLRLHSAKRQHGIAAAKSK